MKDCVIGIDIGTSGCKLLALDAKGEILAVDTQSYPLYHPHEGWSEQQPEDWWQGVTRGLPHVLGALAGARVAGVSFSGQMHGMVALDAAGHVVCRAPLWNDQRTQAQCDEITAVAGGVEAMLACTNNVMLTGCTGGKILWLRQSDPACFARIARILNPKDYVRFCLTGEAYTEVSDASGTGFFDVRQRAWSHSLLARVGLSAELFAPVVESTARTGAVCAAASAATGLPVGTPVYGGGGDAVLSTVAMGLDSPRKVGVTLGTSGVVSMSLPHFVPNPGGRFQIYCGNGPGRWMVYGSSNSAAGSYQWFCDTLAGGASYAALEEAACAVAPGSDGLTFLPYLTGERFPHFDAQAKGGFIGLDARMGLGHFARAVMEGVCWSQKQIFDEVAALLPDAQTEEIVLTGGGAKSALWRQILADVLELPVRTVYGGAHGGAFGAALVAGVGAGLFADLEEAMCLAKPQTEALPNPRHRDIYRAGYKKYAGMYPALRWSFTK